MALHMIINGEEIYSWNTNTNPTIFINKIKI